METASEYLGGLSFILLGFLLCKNQLSHFFFSKIHLIHRWVKSNRFTTSLWGTVVSLATAGDLLMTPFIASGMLHLKRISLKELLLIIIWGRFSACIYVYLATLFLPYWLLLFIIGVTGILFIINKKKSLEPFFISLFYLSLIFFGAYLLKTAGSSLPSVDFFNSISSLLHQFPIALLVLSTLILLATRNIFLTLITGVALSLGGFITSEILLYYLLGTYLGQIILIIRIIPRYHKEYKTSLLVLSFYYSTLLFLTIILLLMELFSSFSLFHWITDLTQMKSPVLIVHINLILHLFVSLVVTLLVTPITRYTEKASFLCKEKVTDEDTIPSEIIVNHEIYLPLIDDKELTLLRYLPNYMQMLRTHKNLEDSEEHKKLHLYFQKHFTSLHNEFVELLYYTSNAKECGDYLNKAEQSTFIVELEKNLYEFTLLIDTFRNTLPHDSEVKNKWFNFIEAMDSILLIMLDVIESPDEVNKDLLHKVTSDRENFINELRNQYIEQLDTQYRLLMIKLFNLFESNIWHIRKICSIFIEKK
jgi:hypothetical protein